MNDTTHGSAPEGRERYRTVFHDEREFIRYEFWPKAGGYFRIEAPTREAAIAERDKVLAANVELHESELLDSELGARVRRRIAEVSGL